MPDGDLELWSIPDFDNGSPSITNRQSIGSSKKVVFPGDVLLSKIVPHIRRAWIVRESNLPQYASTEWLTFHSSKVRPEFLRYALLTDEFNRQMQLNSNGMGSLKRADPEKVGEQQINLPTIRKQKIIADFLDKRLVAIDAVLHQKSEQLKKISSYRQSLITRAVTKGLDPNVEMKDSGVAWIGHVPSHWKILKLKLVATFSSGGTPDRNNKTYWNDGTIPWLKTGELRNNEILSSEEFITVEGLKNSSAKILPKGTVLIAMYGHTRGMTGLLLAPCACNQACLGISCCKKLFNKYLQFVLISCNTYIREKAIGGGQPNLSQEIIADLKIPLPSMNEQIEIVNRINSISEPIERLTKKLNKSLDCLMEYRSSLISAAVTGQLAIEEAAE